MSKHTSAYQIRKTSLKRNFSVVLNDSLGSILEFNTFEEASHICVVMNSNRKSDCRYEVVVVNGVRRTI